MYSTEYPDSWHIRVLIPRMDFVLLKSESGLWMESWTLGDLVHSGTVALWHMRFVKGSYFDCLTAIRFTAACAKYDQKWLSGL
jgi:hypothetical protein